MSHPMKKQAPCVLVLWNQTDEDIYEVWQQEGPRPLEWKPDELVSEVGTVREEMDQLVEAIRANGYRAVLVNVKDDVEKIIAAVTLHEPACVFNLIEYLYDDETMEANVAGLYELFGVAYTGNRPRALATCQSKVRTKILLDDAGLPTAPYMVVNEDEVVPDPAAFDLEYPLIVKPAREDASGGISPDSVVLDFASLKKRCHYIFQEFEQPALVEEYIEGREIHAAILGNYIEGKRKRTPEGQEPPEHPEWEVRPRRPEVLPLFEMEFDDSEFNPGDEWSPEIFTYKAKWDPHSKQFYSMDSVCPPEDLDPELEARIEQVALQAFKVLDCRDYARVDMRVDDDGDPYILEVNPNPDLADGSAYVMCSDASGRTYAQLIGEIVRMALARRARAQAEEKNPRVVTDHLLREYRHGKPPEPKRAKPEPAAAESGQTADESADESAAD
jgi:D-alanine-D-alanine ligase